MIMPQETAAAIALPLDILFSRLSEFCIPRTLCQILRKDASLQEIEFRCEQIACVRNIAEEERHMPILINALARTEYSSVHEVVQSTFVHGLESPGEQGKHTALDRTREQQMLDWIQQNAAQSTPVSKTEIKH
jgi:hypothetical protein